MGSQNGSGRGRDRGIGGGQAQAMLGSGTQGGLTQTQAQSTLAKDIAQKADEYAAKKLGIRTVGPPDQTKTVSMKETDQMYGTEYADARKEYLQSRGITYNDATSTQLEREVQNIGTNTPLSEKMFESQKTFARSALGILSAMTGSSLLGGAAYGVGKKPYIATVGRSSTSISQSRGRDKTPTPPVGSNIRTTTTDSQKVNQKATRLRKASADDERQFMTSSGKTISGRMKGFLAN